MAKPHKKSSRTARTKHKPLSQEELRIITTLYEFENKNGNKVGIAPAELERELQMTWSQINVPMQNLGRRELIEMHKGPGYTRYWLPVEFEDDYPNLWKNNYSPIWEFRLSEKGRRLYTSLSQEIAPPKPPEKTAPGQANTTFLGPLSDNAAAVLDILKKLPADRALTGPKIIEKLADESIFIDQSTLTKSIIPALKAHGVKNKPRIGYYLHHDE